VSQRDSCSGRLSPARTSTYAAQISAKNFAGSVWPVAT